MITYSGIISYFKDFANKHSQINSFSVGETDQLELKKINEYPVFHINITGTTIEDNTIAYDVDAYILTGINDDQGDKWREDSLANTLLIMQDLRSEFFKGKYILNPTLLLQGSESISCAPIDESFNNRVFGWSTSITVTGVNESTQCNIPYEPTEIFDGLAFTAPVTNLENLQWYSATEDVQSNVTVGGYLGNTTITGLAPFINTDSFDTVGSLTRQGENTLLYDFNKQGINLNGLDTDAFSNMYMIWKSASSSFYTSTFGLKVSHIKDSKTNYTELFWMDDSLTTPTKGFRILVGGSTVTEVTHRNMLVINKVSDNSFTLIGNVADESTDYLREESLVIVIQASGESGTNKTYVHLEGIESSGYIDANLDDNTAYYLGTGGQLTNSNNFIFKELVLNDVDLPNQTELYRWLKHR